MTAVDPWLRVMIYSPESIWIDQCLGNRVLRIAPGFLPGSCSFLFNQNDWGAGAEGDTGGSGPPPVTAS